MSHLLLILWALAPIEDLSVTSDKLSMTTLWSFNQFVDDEPLLPGGALAVSPDREVFYLDSRNHRIVVLSEQGEWLRTFGSKGQGPGEFSAPETIGFMGDTLALVDSGNLRLSYFQTDGTHLNDVPLGMQVKAAFRPGFFDGGAMLLDTISLNGMFVLTRDLSIYDPQMKRVQSLIAFDQPKIDWARANDPGFWQGFLTKQFLTYGDGYPLGVVIGDKAVVMRTMDSQMRFIDREGKNLTTVTRQRKPKLFTKEAKRAQFEQQWINMTANPMLARYLTEPVFENALTQIDDLTVLAPVVAMVPLGEGFGVIADYDPATQAGVLETFDAAGRFLGAIDYRAPINALTASKDRIYYLDDEDGDVVIRCKRIKGLPSGSAAP